MNKRNKESVTWQKNKMQIWIRTPGGTGEMSRHLKENIPHLSQQPGNQMTSAGHGEGQRMLWDNMMERLAPHFLKEMRPAADF